MIKKIIILILISVCAPALGHCSVLFEDNFNGYSDWSPQPGTNDTSPAGSSASCDYGGNCSGFLGSWDFYNTTGLWWGPTYHDTISVNNQSNHDGTSGKSVIIYNESNIGASGDGWGADCQLTKLLPSDYQELYIRIWLKYQSGWQWSTADDMFIKTLRVMHFDRTGSAYTYFSGGYSGPIALYDFKHSNTYGTRGQTTYRGGPQSTWYSMGGDNENDYLLGTDSTTLPTASGMPADGNWHCIELHVKMNTYSGGVWNSDGVYQIYHDGVSKFSRSDIKWKTTGMSASDGWNMVGIGGNAYNLYTPATNHGEQWYAIDDIVISTSYVGTSYVISPPTSTVTCSISTVSGQTVTNPTFTISGTASTTSGTISSVTCPGLTITGTNSWSTTATLASGLNAFTFAVTDSNGSTGTATITVTYNPSGGGVSAASFLGGTFAGGILQ